MNSKQIDLSYYDLFGSLKLVLVKSSKIANRQEVNNYARDTSLLLFYSMRINGYFLLLSTEIKACKMVEIFHCIKSRVKYKAHDVPTLQLADILLKDFKKWTELEGADARLLSDIGMSCIGVSIGQLLYHPEHLVQEIQYSQQMEHLGGRSEWCEAGKGLNAEMVGENEGLEEVSM
ncbi:hypothetical protein K1719_031724 [Acacia pycnantha]|nr:hypothetical protein K1719_031724 [Acacia pycnantha]